MNPRTEHSAADAAEGDKKWKVKVGIADKSGSQTPHVDRILEKVGVN